MKRRFAILVLLVTGSMTAFAGEWTGYISDQQCAASGAKKAKASDWINPKAFASCAQKCAKAGSPVVFVTEDNKILKFDADSLKKAMPNLGHRVRLTGTLENDTLKIDKIATIQYERADPR